MNVYVSGPISGMKDHNDPAFAQAQERLERQGYHVFNPRQLNGSLPDGLPREVYLKRDIQILYLCEAIYMLAGWETSRGARAEWIVAQEFNLKILYEYGAARFEVDDLPSIDTLLQGSTWRGPPETTGDRGDALQEALRPAEGDRRPDQETGN